MTIFAKKVSEKQIEEALKKGLRQLFGVNHLYLKFKAVMFNGVPDRLILLPGRRIYFVELKKPKGGVLSPVQITVHRLFDLLGFKVRVLWTFEQLEEFLFEVSL